MTTPLTAHPTTIASRPTSVLIAGAGPTGLTLALWLTRLGVDCRIIDKAPAPGLTSRALAVQARTLEFHRQVGIVDDVISAGTKIERLSVRTPRQIKASLKLDTFGAGLTRYPFAFALPQDIHETVLIDHLGRAGVNVERGVELSDFEETLGGITATLVKDGVSQAVQADYLCGCDGAHSAVRHGLKLGFPGGAYEQSFYVADVEGEGDYTRNGMDACIGTYGFALVLPVRQLGSMRLIGIVPQAHEGKKAVTFEDIRSDVERDTGITVSKVNWFSTYRVHHRVADKFRVGRAFIAGDAGHVHSPAGGQGMNTGIGDAVNLAWKLAAVLQGRAHAKLLDSYEPERIAFARLLIASTDRAFNLVTGRSALSGFWRRHIMPKVAGLLGATTFGSRTFFALLSQTRITYRDKGMSAGSAGRVKGGDRLPYVEDGAQDNFACLGSLDWQVHVYGEASAEFRQAVATTGFALHSFAWSPAAHEAGFARNGAYFVRPDGHVGLAMKTQDTTALYRYIDNLAIKPRAAQRRPMWLGPLALAS